MISMQEYASKQKFSQALWYIGPEADKGVRQLAHSQ